MKGIWFAVAFAGCIVVILACYAFFAFSPTALIFYLDQGAQTATETGAAAVKAPVVAHLPTPMPVKAVYITACTTSSKPLREAVLSTVAGTEINSLAIDLKDYTGTLSYASTSVSEPYGLSTSGRQTGCRISDLPQFVTELHGKGIYAIGRITVFQDPLYASAHPDLAVQSISRPGRPWTDKNGLAYIDPDFAPYWDRVAQIALEAHSIGFDEINFDYIRFPSDGVMTDAEFALPASTTKAAVIADFFAYLQSRLKPEGVVMSADLFGQTTVNRDDLGIGQILEDALPYFDYVSPMVYPSHFADNFDGYANPAAYPYEVVRSTMISAVERAAAASSTPDKLRPWLQAFDLGAVYTPAMVQAEKRAVYDAGLSGWMLWNAGSRYNKEELMPVSGSGTEGTATGTPVR
ncbi:MAG: putative glycoside hydrolase [Minisyncoccia bacterium]|jgi:hypothetical protein